MRHHPADFGLRSHWVWILLGIGRLDLAETATEALEAEAADGHALQARLRLESDRYDETHLRAYVEDLAETRDWTAADAISAGDFLLGVRSPWAFELASAILSRAAQRFVGNFRLRILHVRALIACRADDEAAEVIDAIPERHQRRETLELRAWAAARRGEHETAKALWRTNIATSYFAAVDCPIDQLIRLTPPDHLPPDGGVTAFIVFRNEAPQIPGFLAHHRRLGVRRFVFFDHMSSDDSRALLLAEPDVIVYDCPDSYQFSWSGRRWVNEIVAREGARGWGLQLDADEHLIYPGFETIPIDRFVAYLDAQGFEGVRGYMLDVFPPRLLDDDFEPAPFSQHRWFDDDYILFGQERPPYLQPSGGVRARLFEAKEFLHKTPLWRLDAGLLINSHETTHLKFADVSAALLHYKLMNVALRGRHAAAEAAGTAYVEADFERRRHAPPFPLRRAAGAAVARRSHRPRRLARTGAEPDAGRAGADGYFRPLSRLDRRAGVARSPHRRQRRPRAGPGVGMVARGPRIIGAILQDVGAMARPQRCLVSIETGAVDWRHVAAARGRFVVDQRRERRPHHAQPGGAGAQAEIDVVIGDGEVLLVEAAEPLERIAPDQHAGARHRAERLPRAEPPLRPRRIRRHADVPMAGVAAKPGDDAGVLQGSIGVKQLRADDRRLRIIETGDHLLQPSRRDDLDVVVEQQQQRPVAERRAAIDRAGEVERRGADLDAEALRVGRGIERQGSRVGRAVVDTVTSKSG